MSAMGMAVITGASSGMGKIYSQRLASRGYDLLLVARNVEQLQRQAEELQGGSASFYEVYPLDLSSRDGLGGLVKRIASDQKITMVVNAAGLVAGGALSETDGASLASMLDVNVTALTAVCAAAARNFSAKGEGTIVNISSATAFIDSPGAAAYAASKAFVLHLTYSLELELKARGIRVQTVLPGYTRTPMLKGATHIPDHLMMEVDTLVDAALAGLDAGELVTIPSLEDVTKLVDWEQAKADLAPFLARRDAATRYTGSDK